MRTKGLVGALLISLGFSAASNAADQPTPLPSVDSGPVAAAPAAADESVMCYEMADCPAVRDGWRDALIGSTSCCHLYAGTELTALQIDARTGGRITASFSDTTAPGVSTIAFNERGGVTDRGYAPRFWLGANLTDKWGVRGRYWNLSDNSAHFPTLNPAIAPVGNNFGTFEVTETVEAWATDLEAVRTMQWGGWKADVFMGGRHAHYRTDADLLAFGVFTTGNFVNLTLQNGCGFDGAGITYGGSLRRQIGCTPLYLFGSARGSFLDGHSDSMGRSDGTVASSPSAPLVGAATVRRNDADATMTIAEFQAGLEFNWPLQAVPANFFFRTAYEYQHWNLDGPPTGGAGFGGTIGELTTNSFASAGLGSMILSGFSIGTGLTW
jgi:hypothetical protein